MIDYSYPVPTINKDKELRFATAYQRFLSALIDFVLIALCVFFSFMGLSNVMKNSDVAIKAYHGYHDYYLQTHIYYEKDNGDIDLITYDNYKGYENGVYLFYSDFLGDKCPMPERDKYSIYWFNVFIYGQEDINNKYSKEELDARENLIINDGPALFEYKKDGDNVLTNEFAILKNGVEEEKAIKYYDVLDENGKRLLNTSIYTISVSKFVSKDWFMEKYYNYQNITAFWPMFSCLAFFPLIFRLIIPLCLKKRQSIGKLIIKLGIYNKEAEPIKWYGQIIRFIIPYLLYLGLYLFSNFVYGGDLLVAIAFIALELISLLMISFSKNHMAIHDRFIKSYVIDINRSTLVKEEIIEIKKYE